MIFVNILFMIGISISWYFNMADIIYIIFIDIIIRHDQHNYLDFIKRRSRLLSTLARAWRGHFRLRLVNLKLGRNGHFKLNKKIAETLNDEKDSEVYIFR